MYYRSQAIGVTSFAGRTGSVIAPFTSLMVKTLLYLLTGSLLFFVVASVCLYVCLDLRLSRCSFKSLLLFLFLDGIEPFFAR